MLALKIPFKKQQFEAREEAILDAVNRLLTEKGFDLMTMDDVADAVGVAKGSLYKHFSSKERLAAAAMSRLLSQTLDVLDGFPEAWTAGRRLEEILRWTLQHRPTTLLSTHFMQGLATPPSSFCKRRADWRTIKLWKPWYKPLSAACAQEPLHLPVHQTDLGTCLNCLTKSCRQHPVSLPLLNSD